MQATIPEQGRNTGTESGTLAAVALRHCCRPKGMLRQGTSSRPSFETHVDSHRGSVLRCQCWTCKVCSAALPALGARGAAEFGVDARVEKEDQDTPVQ